MIVRALDVNNDWTFGKGRNNYKSGLQAVAQSIQTRLSSFLGDCFFATDQGIDWFNLEGSKKLLELNLSINAVIMNTPNVLQMNQVSLLIDEDRDLNIVYDVTTIFGQLISTATPSASQLILTQDGQILTTEDGGFLSI